LPNTPRELETLIIHKFFDPDWEPAYELYREHLAALNGIVAGFGCQLEGSLFNKHMITDVPQRPDPEFLPKRRNFALFCTGGDSLFEIGFNAGHSCLLALTINPDLRYVGVDMGYHDYVQPCFEYLRQNFGDRVQLHLGDSREVLPVLREHGLGQYSLYHLDGGHEFGTAHADLTNILAMSQQPATLLFDDTGHADLDALCDYYVMRGRLARIQFNRLWADTINHRMFRIVPA
jgi:hypothetical protein